MASASLFTEVRYHEPLFDATPYIPECTLFGRGASIGGIQFSGDPSTRTACASCMPPCCVDEDVLKQPVLQPNRRNVLIEQLEIDIEPSVSVFEEELRVLINKDRLEKKKLTQTPAAPATQEAFKVSIVERRLRVSDAVLVKTLAGKK